MAQQAFSRCSDVCVCWVRPCQCVVLQCNAGLVQDGQVPGAVVTYLAAALGTGLGAVTGTTPLIIAAESAVGIKEGGRTGLVAVTVSGCFLLSVFLAPLFQVSALKG